MTKTRRRLPCPPHPTIRPSHRSCSRCPWYNHRWYNHLCLPRGAGTVAFRPHVLLPFSTTTSRPCNTRHSNSGPCNDCNTCNSRFKPWRPNTHPLPRPPRRVAQSHTLHHKSLRFERRAFHCTGTVLPRHACDANRPHDRPPTPRSAADPVTPSWHDASAHWSANTSRPPCHARSVWTSYVY